MNCKNRLNKQNTGKKIWQAIDKSGLTYEQVAEEGEYHSVVKKDRESTDADLALTREKIADKKREINSAKTRYDDLGETQGITEEEELSIDKLNAFLEELKDLNIFRNTDATHYLFTRLNFYQMMGSQSEVEDKMFAYMEE